MTSDIVEVTKIENAARLQTDSDLSICSLREAHDKITHNGELPPKETILIVHTEDSVAAGRLANELSIDRVIALPEWAMQEWAWVLCGDFSAAGSPGA